MENMNSAQVLQFPEVHRCPRCHGEVDADAKYCMHCGGKLVKKEKYVPQKNITKIPLKTLGEIDTMFSFLATPERKTPGRIRVAERNSLMFLVGITTGLRASDLTTLKASCINGYRNGQIFVVEKKTGKGRMIAVHKDVIDRIKAYMSKYCIGGDDYIFETQKHVPMVVRAWNFVITSAAKSLGWNPILYGSHTIRKTYAYQFYMKANTISRESGYRALSILCKELHHSSEAITLAYIGIDEEEIRDICNLTTEQYADLINRLTFEEENE